MGTLKRLFNKIINKTDESKKETEKVEEELKQPKTKSERKYKTAMDYMSAGYGFTHTNPEFHPKRTKLKGYQKEAKRSTFNSHK